MYLDVKINFWKLGEKTTIDDELMYIRSLHISALNTALKIFQLIIPP